MMKILVLGFMSFCLHAESLTCFDFATNSNRNLTIAETINLCKGTTSTVALYCFDVMESRGLSHDDRISLCKGAKDASVVTCFDNSANRSNLTLADRLELCSQR